MCKLISKCCVCGKIYAITTCNIVGQSSDAEKVSHGYCSPECSKSKEVQIMVWSDEHGIFVLERAFIVGQKMYFEGKFQKSYVTVGLFPITCNIETWSEEMGFYDEYPQMLGCTKENKLAEIKKLAHNLGLIIRM